MYMGMNPTISRPRYLDQLVAKQGNGQVKVITGVRRCGKSYLLGTIFKSHLLSQGFPEEAIVEMAFDRYRNRRYRDPEEFYPWVMERLEGKARAVVMLDEVQLLDAFSEVLIDLMAIPGVDVYVTGSNARLLSRDVVTEFRGRGDEVRLAPLSFSEFAAVWDGDQQRAYDEYSVYGGMPASLGMDHGEKARYLGSLFSEIYLADIVERNGIRRPDELEAVLDVLSSSTGSLTNPKRISDTFRSKGGGKGPDSATVAEHIDCFVDAFVVERAQRYDIKGRKYIGSPYKYYFCDMGLRNARMNFRQVEPTHAMEVVLYNELRSRGLGVDVGEVTRYDRDEGGKQQRTKLEVDFVCNRGSERVYVQSAYAIPSEAKLAQEQASLMRIHDSFRKVLVVRDNIVPRYNDHGVLMVGVLDFLTDESYLGL